MPFEDAQSLDSQGPCGEIPEEDVHSGGKGGESSDKEVLEPDSSKNMTELPEEDAVTDNEEAGLTRVAGEAIEEKMQLETQPSMSTDSGTLPPAGSQLEKCKRQSGPCPSLFAQIEQPGLFVPGESINLTHDWPRCVKCKCIVDPLKVAGKSQGNWKCSSCNSKMVQLNRIFGGWPVKGWGEMSEEDEEEFWKEASGKKTKHLKELVVTKMAFQQIKTEETNFTGDWLPLQVWETRGYDAQRIKDTSTDRDHKAHPRMGEVYKLTLETDILSAAKKKSTIK